MLVGDKLHLGWLGSQVTKNMELSSLMIENLMVTTLSSSMNSVNSGINLVENPNHRCPS